jgi:Family of unknown function (DUF5317)
MFMLWAIPAGLIVGTLVGGSIDGLTAVRFRWAPLAIVALLVQVVLFTPLGDQIAGGNGPAVYVISTAAVFVAVVRNLRLSGMPIVGLGALGNVAAIAANGGAMPADAPALASAGLDGPGAHTNSVVLATPALRFLTDIYAVPAWVPLANVFSVGDALIGIGIVVVIVAAMRRRSAVLGTNNPGATESAAP